jgi:periplasmic protein TonB
VSGELNHVKPFDENDFGKAFGEELFSSIEKLRPSPSNALIVYKANKTRASKLYLSFIASVICHSFALAAFIVPVVLSATLSELPAIQVEILADNAEISEEKVALAEPAIKEPKIEEQKVEVLTQLIQNPVQLATTTPEIAEEIIRPVKNEAAPQKQPLKTARPKITSKISPPDSEPKKLNLADIRREKQKREAQIERDELADEKLEAAKQQRLAAKKIANSNRAERYQKASEKIQEASENLERANAMSHSAYASLVSAQINANKVYPTVAREQGVSGVVSVAFTIGRAGRVNHASVISSSGSLVLDSSAKQAVLAIALPPPPDGKFSSSVPIRYGLR